MYELPSGPAVDPLYTKNSAFLRTAHDTEMKSTNECPRADIKNNNNNSNNNNNNNSEFYLHDYINTELQKRGEQDNQLR